MKNNIGIGPKKFIDQALRKIQSIKLD